MKAKLAFASVDFESETGSDVSTSLMELSSRGTFAFPVEDERIGSSDCSGIMSLDKTQGSWKSSCLGDIEGEGAGICQADVVMGPMEGDSVRASLETSVPKSDKSLTSSSSGVNNRRSERSSSCWQDGDPEPDPSRAENLRAMTDWL